MKVRIGYGAWVAGVVQFFVLHVVVQSAWARPYSWARNNISDLGNAHCALQTDPESRYVCSPGHELMNVSFVTLGALLAVGAALTGGGVLWRGGGRAAAARLLLAGGGLGFVLAGLAPADVDENQHALGALLVMGSGNLGLVLAGWALAERVPAWARRVTGLLGVVALTAFGLFLSTRFLGLGMGGMERVAAFPVLLWALAAGGAGLLGGAVPRRDARPGRNGAETVRG
ncbi:DUF998 domain-containing protein [Streptomyces albus subsp. chlorinus]|uniref:DUF998 domain-containing protein n=1 Tax=Streptomyces albus TaxID=1888 RepID=UPI00156FA8DC